MIAKVELSGFQVSPAPKCKQDLDASSQFDIIKTKDHGRTRAF